MYYIRLQKTTKTHLIFVHLLVVGATANAHAEADVHEPSSLSYTVVEGDTLSQIAEHHSVSTEQITRLNHLTNDVIRPGQELIISQATNRPEDNENRTEREERGGNEAADQQEQAPLEYVIGEADTLGCIAARFNVSIEELDRINRGLRPDDLRPGQRLNIPGDHSDSLTTSSQQHEVRQGETLGSIAEELGVTVDDILRWNPSIDASSIQPGQVLAIWQTRRLVHVVESGEIVSSIASRYGVTSQDIVRWNPGLDPDHITIGQRLTIRSFQPPSESIGSPTCGRLLNGRQLPPHPAYVIREPERSYATEETIVHLQSAFDEVMRSHPNAPRVRVHDLSLPEGGPIDDHRSHQSGRDVDIIYYQRRCPHGECQLRPVLPRELALGPQWTLLEHWLRSDVAQLVFIDYGLQEVLYNYARRHGASSSELEAWFQYPRGRQAQVGIIRHFRNHFDHVHVRFRCPENDEGCQ